MALHLFSDMSFSCGATTSRRVTACGGKGPEAGSGLVSPPAAQQLPTSPANPPPSSEPWPFPPLCLALTPIPTLPRLPRSYQLFEAPSLSWAPWPSTFQTKRRASAGSGNAG